MKTPPVAQRKKRRTKAENPAQPRLYRRCDAAHENGDKKVLKYTEKTRVGKPRTASVDARTQGDQKKTTKEVRGFIYKTTVIRRVG
jgi:hypothetical protein